MSLRDIWPHEAYDFTKWLRKNLHLLAEVLEMPRLRLHSNPPQRGNDRADIICFDQDGIVVIENQLTRTDNQHLGQLLCYASQINARKVVWVAEFFLSKHVVALDFLNQICANQVKFYAITIEFEKDSLHNVSLAYNPFHLKVSPGVLSKSSIINARLRLDAERRGRSTNKTFWEGFANYIAANNLPISYSPASSSSQFYVRIGWANANIIASTNLKNHRLSIRFCITHRGLKERYYSYLQQVWSDMENEIQLPLEWTGASIALYKENSPISDVASWPDYFEWISSTVIKLTGFLMPHIKTMRSSIV